MVSPQRSPVPDARAAAVLAEIEHAFDGVSRAGGITLHEATAMDDHKPPAECRAARAQDVDTRWQDVPDEAIAAHPSVFPYLDVRGHVYYTPAFLSWLLRYGYGHPSTASESAQFAVDPAGKHEGGRHWLPHELYTPAQCHAIARCLAYVYDVLDERSCCSYAKDHLDAYWSRYL